MLFQVSNRNIHNFKTFHVTKYVHTSEEQTKLSISPQIPNLNLIKCMPDGGDTLDKSRVNNILVEYDFELCAVVSEFVLIVVEVLNIQS